MGITTAILCAAVGYFLGAIPSGVVMGRLQSVDVQSSGSGHTGGLNVYRTTGSIWASALTAILDLALAGAAVSLARTWSASPWAGPLAGVMAIVGHNWSVYIGMHGGVGLSSIAGALLALAPVTTLITGVALFVLWGLLNRVVQHPPRSTILVMILVGPALWLLKQPIPVVVLGIVGAVPIIVKEFGDIHRVYDKTESGT